MNESIPGLEITTLPNGNLRLEDKSYGDGAIVDVHPCQVRLMAERLGLVRKVSASSADVGRTCGRHECLAENFYSKLERLVAWLEVMEARADQLHENITHSAARGHEDLAIEVAQSAALADIVEQVLRDAQADLSRGDLQRHVCLCNGVEAVPNFPASSPKNGTDPKSGSARQTGVEGGSQDGASPPQPQGELR
jgi:hypothetical protein